MYGSTPTMEEDPLEFRSIMPVIEQVQPRTPAPNVDRIQPGTPIQTRLPNPMPTFALSPPPNQGPRAFFRASNIFQPSIGTYIPFPELLTPITTTTAPFLVTPATLLYTSAGTAAQTRDAAIFAVTNPGTTEDTSGIHGEPFNTAFLNESRGPTYSVPTAPRTYIPSVNTIASLKRQLNKLEAENNRLRRENQEKYAELEETAKNSYRQAEERIKQLERLVKGENNTATQSTPQQYAPNEGQPDQYGPSMARGSSSTHRTFSDDERLTGNNNFQEWAEAVMIELQVIGILQTIFSECTGSTNWSVQVKGRADAVAHSLILHSVDAKIRPQIRGLSSAYQMWILLCSRYNVASIFENHRIMAEFESLNFV